MLNQNTVTCFLALAQTLSFTKAAKRLGVTQQCVSKNIAKLESDLGVTLFRRNRHFVWLTSEGEQFYSLFYKFSKDLFQLTQLCGKKTPEGDILRLGISEGLDLSEALRYASWNTGQEIRVAVGLKTELDEMLRLGHLDAVLEVSKAAAQTDQATTVAEVPMVLLTARHLLLENLKQAMALPLISVSGDQERQWPEPCKTSDATGRHILSVSNPESAWASLLLGQGAIVSNGCSNYAADSRVQAFPLEYTCLLVCRRRRDLESLAALLNEMADFYQNHFHAMETSSTYK